MEKFYTVTTTVHSAADQGVAINDMLALARVLDGIAVTQVERAKMQEVVTFFTVKVRDDLARNRLTDMLGEGASITEVKPSPASTKFNPSEPRI